MMNVNLVGMACTVMNLVLQQHQHLLQQQHHHSVRIMVLAMITSTELECVNAILVSHRPIALCNAQQQLLLHHPPSVPVEDSVSMVPLEMHLVSAIKQHSQTNNGILALVAALVRLDILAAHAATLALLLLLHVLLLNCVLVVSTFLPPLLLP